MSRLVLSASKPHCRTKANSICQPFWTTWLFRQMLSYSGKEWNLKRNEDLSILSHVENKHAQGLLFLINPCHICSFAWISSTSSKILLYVFKCLNNLAPGYLTELVIPYNPTRALRSETANLLTVPSVRTKTYGERRFDKAASTLWNNLPSQLRNAKNIECFKRLLKTHLFRQAYDL